MTSHPWTPRSGPLSFGERLMLARVADSYPCPLDTIRWIKRTSASDGTERIGECDLEERGWLRIRRRRPGSVMTIEITGRAMRECPWLADPAARARFVAEVRSSLMPEQVQLRGAMEPAHVVLLCASVAFDSGAVDADLRACCVAIFGAVTHLAAARGFRDADALREAIVDGYDELADDLAAQVVAAVGDGLRVVLRQHGSEFLLDGVPVATSH